MDEICKKDVGKRLLLLRKEHGYKSQADLGHIIGASYQTISDWETGKALPEYDHMAHLSHLYGVSINYLLCKSEYKLPQNADIGKEIGLSEKGIEILRRFVLESSDNHLCSDSLKGINFLLEKLYEEYANSEITEESDNILTAIYKLSHSGEYIENINWLDPRKGVEHMHNQWFSINKDIVEEFCFRHKYNDIKAINNAIYPK